VPEWYQLIVGLAAFSLLGTLWSPLLLALPLLLLAIAAPLIFAAREGAHSLRRVPRGSFKTRLKRSGLIALLHLVQPLARLVGRVRSGLWPGRWHGTAVFSDFWPRSFAVRSESWESPEERLRFLEATLRLQHARALRGGPDEPWDLEVRGGLSGGARVLLAVEELAYGQQLVRVRAWPRCRPRGLLLTALFGALFAGAAADHSWIACSVLGAIAVSLAVGMVRDCCHAAGSLLRAARTAGLADA
jgi:hypothetical protein